MKVATSLWKQFTGYWGILFSSETSDDGHSTGVCIGSPPF